MDEAVEKACKEANLTRYRPGERAGHYESFFLRANHPTRPLAFWIRYTLFSPQAYPERAVGELWAVFFDGETGTHVAVKKEVPLADCDFSRSEFFVRVGDARLEAESLRGAIESGAHSVDWHLSYRGESRPLFLFPVRLYARRWPKAKSLVGLPLATFDGILLIDGRAIDVVEWVGSQNHNWGSRHTDHYAWGQVAGFDSHPESFLEVATARVRVGPFWTPFLTPLVLRHGGREHALNRLRQTARARARFDYFTWWFFSENEIVRIEGRIHAPRESFVGLAYANPPGGTKYCLNSKLAACEVRLTDKRLPGTVEVLATEHRAAFEILTDDRSHGVCIRA